MREVVTHCKISASNHDVIGAAESSGLITWDVNDVFVALVIANLDEPNIVAALGFRENRLRGLGAADKLTNVSQFCLEPTFTRLSEDGLKMAFKQRAGVLEVLFGVGFGGGDAVKRFVEDADDPLLFGERRKWKLKSSQRFAPIALEPMTSTSTSRISEIAKSG